MSVSLLAWVLLPRTGVGAHFLGRARRYHHAVGGSKSRNALAAEPAARGVIRLTVLVPSGGLYGRAQARGKVRKRRRKPDHGTPPTDGTQRLSGPTLLQLHKSPVAAKPGLRQQWGPAAPVRCGETQARSTLTQSTHPPTMVRRKNRRLDARGTRRQRGGRRCREERGRQVTHVGRRGRGSSGDRSAAGDRVANISPDRRCSCHVWRAPPLHSLDALTLRLPGASGQPSRRVARESRDIRAAPALLTA
jgi:hypothetical protein